MSDGKKATWKDDINVMTFVIKNAVKLSKTLLPCSLILIIITAVSPFVNILFPKLIIDELMGAQRVHIIIYSIFGTISLNLLFGAVNTALKNYLQVENEKIYMEFNIMIGKKAMEMDYEYIEDPEILDLKTKAAEGFNYYGGVWGLSHEAIRIVSGLITLSGLFYIILQVNFMVMLALLGIVAMSTYYSDRLQKVVYGFWDRLRTYNRKYRYVNSIMLDFKYGKDIRLYDMSEMILDKNRGYVNETYNAYKKQTGQEYKYMKGKGIVGQLQMLIVYAYLTYKVFIENMGLGSFTMFAAAANSFVSTMTELTNGIISLRRACQYTRSFMDFLQLPDIKKRGTLPAKQGVSYELEFKNVSFKYPKTEHMTLKNINLKIKSNQKLSVVGLNGAGKTTLIKLMIRLYDPTEGAILLNGTNIKEFDYEEYLKLFSVVFQDFYLLAASIKENIVLDDSDNGASEVTADSDDPAVKEAIIKAGLEYKINKLDQGIDTQLYRIFHKEGIELSGGEAQKLALARAVYKNAPIIVLDEPTAALDPVAEYEMYRHFDELIKNKTTIYVSHRMSSCRFCDAVAVFNDGSLEQYGTHEMLMREKDGLYYKLFSAQAQYYV